MKAILLFFSMLTVFRGYSQTSKLDDVNRRDTTQSILRIISSDFYERADSVMDSSCLYAIGSARFKIYPNLLIDSLVISLGVPNAIAKPLKEAILASAPHWKGEHITGTTQVIIPLLLFPSALCRRETHEDDFLSSSASMFVYEGKYQHVRRSNYADKAKGRVQDVALILSPLLLKGRRVD